MFFHVKLAKTKMLNFAIIFFFENTVLCIRQIKENKNAKWPRYQKKNTSKFFCLLLFNIRTQAKRQYKKQRHPTFAKPIEYFHKKCEEKKAISSQSHLLAARCFYDFNIIRRHTCRPSPYILSKFVCANVFAIITYAITYRRTQRYDSNFFFPYIFLVFFFLDRKRVHEKHTELDLPSRICSPTGPIEWRILIVNMYHTVYVFVCLCVLRVPLCHM